MRKSICGKLIKLRRFDGVIIKIIIRRCKWVKRFDWKNRFYSVSSKIKTKQYESGVQICFDVFRRFSVKSLTNFAEIQTHFWMKMRISISLKWMASFCVWLMIMKSHINFHCSDSKLIWHVLARTIACYILVACVNWHRRVTSHRITFHIRSIWLYRRKSWIVSLALSFSSHCYW